MHCSRKEKKLLIWFLVLCLLFLTEYSVYAFDPVVPQERLNEIVNIGTITPTQFETLDEATIQSILERSDVRSLLQNHFELLGLYGETSEGIILKTTEDWSRFGEPVALSGTTLQKVYDTWYREKVQNQPELLTGDVEDMEAFFETHFSSTEENRLADGRLMGTDVDWGTFAYERGLPITAGILFVIYQAWWRKRKEEPDEDWGGLEDIYREKFENNNTNYSVFSGSIRSDERIYTFPDWYPRMWTFWKKASAQLADKISLEKGANDVKVFVRNYVFERKTRQQKEFESTLQSVLTELSSEEIRALAEGELSLEELPEFLEKDVVTYIVAEETIRLEDKWSHFSNEFLTEERITTFFENQLPNIEDRLFNHPERVQGILVRVQATWEEKFEEERQTEIDTITAESEALYNDLIRYAVYNYQYQNVADARAKFYLQKVKELDQILAPQKEAMSVVFAKYENSFAEKKEALEEKIQNITYRQELVEEIDYVTPIAELFPYDEPPTPPSSETLEKTAPELLDLNKQVVDKEQEINYFHVSLMAAKALYDSTVGAQLAECKKLYASIEAKILTAKSELTELEKKMDPTRNRVLNHAEVYAEEIDRLFTEELRNLETAYQKKVTETQEYWTPLTNDPDFWASKRAQQNLEGNLAYYKKEYKKTSDQIKAYKKGALLRKIACVGIIEEAIRGDKNKKQKQKRESYSQKRKENPAKKNVVQYLMALEDSGNNTFFDAQKSTLIQLETIQKERAILVENLATLSPYEVGISALEKDMETPNYYSFEAYAEKNNVQNTSWVIKDGWRRAQNNIGRSGGYWDEKYSNYAHSLMASFSPYDERAIATLRDLAQKAHTERMGAYEGWAYFYKQHPLQYEVKYSAQQRKLNALRAVEAERKKLINEQIFTLDARVSEQAVRNFASAQWLAMTPDERRENALTNEIVEAEINASWSPSLAPVNSGILLQHFTAVRESQHLAQEKYLNVMENQEIKNPFTQNVDALLAPIIRQMYYNKTPEGVAIKSGYYDAIVGTTKSEVVIPPPVPVYQKNENGTYTPVDRNTGTIITEPTLEIPVPEFTEMPVVVAETAAIVATVKESVLYMGVEELLSAVQTFESIQNNSIVRRNFDPLTNIFQMEIDGKLIEVDMSVSQGSIQGMSWWDYQKNKIKNYISVTWDQLFLGKYGQGETNLAGTLAELGAGLVGIDAPMDLRDLVKSIQERDWTDSAMFAAFLLPVIGGVKAFVKSGKVSETAVNLGRLVDDLAEGIGISWKNNAEFITPEGFRVKVSDMDSTMKYADDVGSGGVKIYSEVVEIQNMIMKTDLRGAVINGKVEIPIDWNRELTTGDGYIYTDPLNTKNNIRVMKEGNNAAFPNYEQPYYRVKIDEKDLDINGNISHDADIYHILIKSIEL